MKIAGQEIKKANTDVVVFPRGETEIVFKLEAVGSYDEFEKLYPEPLPKIKTLKDGTKVPLINEPEYLASQRERNEVFTFWLVIQTIKTTEGLEFETVDFDDKDTWKNLTSEFKNAGFLEPEIAYLFAKVMDVNALDTKKIDEARESFLARKSQLEQ